MKTHNVVFVDGARTAFGRLGGSLKLLYPTQLAGIAIKGLLEKSGVLERGGFIDSVFIGSAAGCAQSGNVARLSALYAGLPYETSASFIEMQCGSAIDCINHAAWQITCGAADIIIAGGTESHSQKAVKFSTSVEPYKGIAPSVVKSKMSPYPEDNISMIEISDKMAGVWDISREECDKFACESQRRASKAVDAGYFVDEIVPVVTPATKKTPEIVFDKDEHLRPATTLEGLAKLNPVRPGGVTTAGNASGLNDGAAVVLMMSEEKAKELGYTPYARWVGGLDTGCDPKLMGIGPALSNAKLMKKLGLGISDIDLYECNEAFAAQNLSVIKEMENQLGGTVNRENWNPNGGAISFGHPNGASGARIAIFAMKELRRRGGKYAMFSSCCGGGLGVSTLIERY